MTLSIHQIRKSGLCAGCGMCAGLSANNGVVMEESAQGYLRPRVDGPVEPQVSQAVAAACPGITLDDPMREADGPRDPVWGSIVDLRYAWALDPELRYKGSSGAGLSAMLAFLVESGKVDFVVATAMDADIPIRNKTVQIADMEGIKASAGSRYAPSAPLARIGELLDGDRTFAFVGKPCDVAALRQLARIDPRVDRMVPWMFAFFCAGLPSYGGTDVLLRAMGVPDEAQVTSFRFRGEGWPGFATTVTADGQTYRMDYDTSWGSILNRHLQFRCKICPDGIGEFADIAFADGWHIDDNGIASFEEAEGRSLTVVRNTKAQALFEEAIAAGYLATEPAEIRHLPIMQPHQARRKGYVANRLAALKLVGHRLPRFRGLDLWHNTRRTPLAQQARSFVGTLRRLVQRCTEP